MSTRSVPHQQSTIFEESEEYYQYALERLRNSPLQVPKDHISDLKSIKQIVNDVNDVKEAEDAIDQT